jgi:hypothetical protein
MSTMLNPQLIAGLVVGLVIWSLMSDRPLLRDVLAAVASASILDVLRGKHSSQDVGSIIERLSAEISVHPHFTLGVILAAMGATLVSRFAQVVKTSE